MVLQQLPGYYSDHSSDIQSVVYFVMTSEGYTVPIFKQLVERNSLDVRNRIDIVGELIGIDKFDMI